MRLGTGGKGRDLLVPHMNPLDLSLAADRIGQPVQAVADDAVYPLHAGCSEGFCKLIRYGLHDLPLSREQRTWYRLLTGSGAFEAPILDLVLFDTFAASPTR